MNDTEKRIRKKTKIKKDKDKNSHLMENGEMTSLSAVLETLSYNWERLLLAFLILFL